MNKVLVAEIYVLATVISCALKVAGILPMNWLGTLLLPFAAVFAFAAILMIISGALVFDITCLHNKQFKKRSFKKA